MKLFSKRINYTTYSDEELVQVYSQQQTNDCFAEIYNRYAHLVYGTCLKYLKSKEDAQDTMMDIFESISKKIPYQEIKNLNAWLYTVTKNECYQRSKKARKNPITPLNEHFFEKNEEQFMENGVDFTLIKEQEHEHREIMIKKALSQLKPEQRKCVCAFYLEDKTYKQIEMELGYPYSKVKSYIQNGKRKLKILLEEAQIST